MKKVQKKYPITISVIVPVYNVEQYVAECLDSILSQTFTNFELIVIDDKSTDGSLSILYNYAKQDPRIVVVENEHNQGQGPARNAGVARARGRYITFIDPDDYYYTNEALQIMVDAMDETDACIIQSPVVRLLTNGEFVSSDHSPKKKVYNSEEAFYALHHPDKYIQGYACAKIYKAELFDHEGVVFPEGTMEDSVFVARVLEVVKKVVVIDDTLYTYRIRKGSITQKSYTKDEIRKFFKNTFTLIDLVLHRRKKTNSNHDYALKFYVNTYIFQLQNTVSSLKGGSKEVISVIEGIRSASPRHKQIIDGIIDQDSENNTWHYHAINIIYKAIRKGQIMNRELADYIYNLHTVSDKKLRRTYKVYSTLLLCRATRPLSVVYREIFITPQRIKAEKHSYETLSAKNPLNHTTKLNTGATDTTKP